MQNYYTTADRENIQNLSAKVHLPSFTCAVSKTNRLQRLMGNYTHPARYPRENVLVDRTHVYSARISYHLFMPGAIIRDGDRKRGVHASPYVVLKNIFLEKKCATLHGSRHKPTRIYAQICVGLLTCM